jgi:lysophospholipase L1-like esterase
MSSISATPIKPLREVYMQQHRQTVHAGLVKAVIVFYDTDVSDFDDMSLSDEERSYVRGNYTYELTELLSDIQSAGVRVALSGPGLLSDGNYERMISVFGSNKTQMLEDYRLMNKQVCRQLGVTYIDVREAWLASLARGVDPTIAYDGEHPNKEGMRIAAEMFNEVLDGWWGDMNRV